MWATAALLVATIALCAGATETPLPLGPCGPIARRHEHVDVATHELRKLARTPIGRIGVVAQRGGAVVPIPFQVDEREGRKIAMPDGDEPTGDSKPGVLDPDDLLVFLPCDAGLRVDRERLAAAVSGLETWREVEVVDPIDGTHGFAYVVVAEHPPATDRSYVAYDSKNDLVSTAAYRMGMVQALPSYFAVALGHPLGPNLLDGLRLRAEGTLLGNLATVHLTERDARHTLIAWRAGPVRVVRRSRHDVDLLGIGIHISAGVANTAFYPLHVFGPGSMKLPISPGLLFRRITAMGGVDLRDLRGWRFVAPGTPPGGLAIDGTMDEVERAFTANGTWFVLVHEREAILVTITLSENLARAIPFGIVYDDDASHASPPELDPGHVPLVGFQGRGLERLPADRYHFDLRVFLLPDYRPGDERRVLAQQATPLVVEVSGPASPAGAPAAPR
ncbi:MAG TPA: hypothetical protein VMS22_15365 [Candidatus Eisenbacteria bacterium]|nr:hypothetical protein [Candidatus Eisenbacteria bacterium]